MSNIRIPYFAGQFYPAQPEDLMAEIDTYLNKVDIFLPLEVVPKALLSPHAGYNFSGQVSAYSYKTLENKNISRVFLLGNAHANFFEGIAIDDSDYWQTPLGDVKVDQEEVEDLSSLNEQIIINREVHKGDHVLEVQLPFLQRVIKGEFKIVPILFGNSNPANYQILADTLNSELKEDDLIVASSDFSHYPKYEVANEIDRHTLKLVAEKDIVSLEKYFQNIENQNIPNEETPMCGVDAVKTTMLLAKNFNWSAEILQYANSGDILGGDKNKVVGYGSLVFYQK